MGKDLYIHKAFATDKRFPLKGGAGSDAVHSNPVYAYAICKLTTETSISGTGLAFTLGVGNELVCKAIEYLARYIEGQEINELMSRFGEVWRKMADDPNFRWLGPHKGVVHLALAAVTNACFDLWAKSKGVPLWKLLIDLPATDLVRTMDLSYLEEVLSEKEAVEMLASIPGQSIDRREDILHRGYHCYDTSVGWFNYSDERVRENVLRAMARGFTAMKLKVGSKNLQRDIQRAYLVRETAGDAATIMLDANQQWTLPQAIEACRALQDINPYWVEEPTHPDDVMAHVTLAREAAPVKLALGEHVPNRIIFKNFLQSGCMSFNQADVVRVGGISEFMAISLLSKKFGVPVVPHVGDMGQIHQHLVLFNHIRIGHEALFLEHIPHLREYFQFPATIRDGYYATPQEPGMSADLLGV